MLVMGLIALCVVMMEDLWMIVFVGELDPLESCHLRQDCVLSSTGPLHNVTVVWGRGGLVPLDVEPFWHVSSLSLFDM